jgi:hypothetical protein
LAQTNQTAKIKPLMKNGGSKIGVKTDCQNKTLVEKNLVKKIFLLPQYTIARTLIYRFLFPDFAK